MRGRTLTARSRVLVGLMMVAGLAGAAAADGPWVWPLDGPRTVSRPFDPPASRYGPGHRGADLPGRPGQAVHATGGGRISYAGLLAGRGVVVVVHGDLRSTYEPVTPLVRVGDQVAAGDVIGRLAPGHSGCPDTCLHWGLLRGDVYLDPVRLVRAGPSRLLPLDRGPVFSPVRPAAAPAAGTDLTAPVVSAPALTATPAPAAEPAFGLRAADTAWGAGAMAALVAGLLLLRRPRRPPDGPVTPSHPVVHAPDHAPAVVVGPQPVAGLVDLTSERHRRRPEVA